MNKCGYGEELDLMCADGRISDFLKLPFLRQPKELTERSESSLLETLLPFS